MKLETFLDAYFAERMSALHIPGATFVLVKDGEVFFSKGHGYADLEKQIHHDPDETVFRAASISKAFTAVGVLQLYERGSINLDDDVNSYLKDFQLPATYPQPVTFAHLLTHTDGLYANVIGGAARSPTDLKPLKEVVIETMPRRIAAPGQTLTYGNFASDLLGVLIEDVSGKTFSQYMHERCFPARSRSADRPICLPTAKGQRI